MKVSELLGALSLKKSATDAVKPTASKHTPTAEESEKALAAHQEALSSLQRLESSPVTAPLLQACVRRPSFWGGFLIRPAVMEFWCDGKFRLHSRIVYEREGGLAQKEVKGETKEGKWSRKFLAP
jgi:pyridoxine/pyridoxamine 5'-phosphate oxidase